MKKAEQLARLKLNEMKQYQEEKEKFHG